MPEPDEEIVVPIIKEELRIDTARVYTGGVRVIKSLHNHSEILEHELRKGRVEVSRIKTNQIVDGPQELRRVGNTLIIPVVSEVLRIEKQWVLTEEIHVTQIEEQETIEDTITLQSEQARVERLDADGNVTASSDSQ